MPDIAFNWIDGHSDDRLQALRLAFESAGVAVSIPADIEAALWTKLALIAPMSGVGAVTRITDDFLCIGIDPELTGHEHEVSNRAA